MNTIKLHVDLDDNRQPVGLHQVQIMLSAVADADNHMGGAIRSMFEMEILRGVRLSCADGGTEYLIELDTEKATYLRQLLTIMFFSPESN